MEIMSLSMQGVVIGVGELSEFGSIFQMMQTEEVYLLYLSYVHKIHESAIECAKWFVC